MGLGAAKMGGMKGGATGQRPRRRNRRAADLPAGCSAMHPPRGQPTMASSTRSLPCAAPLCSGQVPAAACSSRISTWAEGKLQGGRRCLSAAWRQGAAAWRRESHPQTLHGSTTGECSKLSTRAQPTCSHWGRTAPPGTLPAGSTRPAPSPQPRRRPRPPLPPPPLRPPTAAAMPAGGQPRKPGVFTLAGQGDAQDAHLHALRRRGSWLDGGAGQPASLGAQPGD